MRIGLALLASLTDSSLAAKLRIKIDRKRGVQTPPEILKLAGARQATEQEAAELRAAGAVG